jgi:hypothetical protein
VISLRACVPDNLPGIDGYRFGQITQFWLTQPEYFATLEAVQMSLCLGAKATAGGT